MSDLIRKSDVINALCEDCKEDCKAISCDYQFFKNLPTVDAVEVVRCGECKWTIKDIGKYPYCRMNRDINGDCRQVSEHGFCSYGERKEASE